MNRRQYLLTMAAIALSFAAALYAINRPGRPAPATVRLSYARPVEPLFVEPAAPAPLPEPYPTVKYCTARPWLAESAHPCRDEGGDVEL